MMADRPILFSAPMVRALLLGNKTQTRRIMSPQPPEWVYPNDLPGYSCLTPAGHIEFRGRYIDPAGVDHGPASKFIKLPFLKGDRLWVREAYRVHRAYDDLKPSELGGDQDVWPELDRDNCDAHGRYRHSRFMPRWASRLTLTVTDVRVQRLQAITLGDICAEGLGASIYDFKPVQRGFDAWIALWDSINGAGAWAENPWVTAITFDVRRGNIDG